MPVSGRNGEQFRGQTLQVHAERPQEPMPASPEVDLPKVRFGSMSLKKSEMRVAELSIGAFLASFSLDRRP